MNARTMMPLVLTVVTLCVSADMALSAEHAFVCSAEPLELLEGGPVTLRLTLKYRGDRSVHVWNDCLAGIDTYVTLNVPQRWGTKGLRTAILGKISLDDIPDGVFNG